MKDAGYAHMGVGSARGKDKAELAAKAAISSPLLETSIQGATGVIINITASPDVGLQDVDTAASMISAEANANANVIWGVAFDPELEDEMRITIVATGFEKKFEEQAQKITAKKAEPVKEVKVAPKQEEVVEEGNDDLDFDDIFSVFKK